MPPVTLERRDDVALLWLDTPGKPVNTISPAFLDAFGEVMKEVRQSPELRAAVVISAKPGTFVAGADVEELRAMNAPADVERMVRHAHGIIRNVQASGTPVVAAIHGACLGGGLELALACTYRLATEHKKTVFGLPEVKLGLFPGGGGTQFLPRLVGLQQALPMILTGKNVYPRKARRLGLVDALIHADGLEQAAIRAARGLADGSIRPDRSQTKQPLQERLIEKTALGRRIVYNKAREQVVQQTGGHYPAPLRALEAVRTGLEDSLDAGFDAEARGFAEMAFTPEARQLMFLFFAQQKAKKNPWKKLAYPVRRTAVLGAGLMGAGIAEVSAAKAGHDVLLKDMKLELAAQGKKEIWRDLKKKQKKGALSSFELDQQLGRVEPTDSYDGFEHVDLVIEAVPEKTSIKHAVIRELEARLPKHAVLASNTSSIPITELAEASERPENMLGMHYFSPVPTMPLLEIIRTEQTSERALATAYQVGMDQGKTVIVVNDGPGFYTTRILAVYQNEALDVLSEGADAEQVDRAMERFGFPMGPYELFDLVGIGTAAKITDVLGPQFEDRGITANPAAGHLFEAGFEGQTSKGFYTYEEDKRGRPKKQSFNEAVYQFFGGRDRQPVDEQEVQQRLALSMVNAAVHCLDAGILDTPRDGDIGAVFGLGFPPFRGGPFRYVDSQGPRAIVARLERLERKYGERFAPAPSLRRLAEEGGRFYEEDEA